MLLLSLNISAARRRECLLSSILFTIAKVPTWLFFLCRHLCSIVRPSLPHKKKTLLLVCLLFSGGLALSTVFFFSLLLRLSISHYGQPYNSTTTFNHMLHTQRTQHEPTNIGHIVFGIGGSAATWHTRRHYTELWWRPGATRGFVWLDQNPSDTDPWPETSPPYKISDNTSSFKYTCPYGTRSAIRMARIVKESFELGLENVRWFVMGDDDTVFFPDNLATVLSKYDHNQMYYIGGNSESVEQDLVHFYTMAYGGGGIAISYPLAEELVTILDGCIDRYAHLFGSDQKIQSCISEIGVEITKEPGFHQVDIRGNPYGLLAAHPVAPLVSLHHLDYVDPIFPNMNRSDSIQKLVTAYKADPGRTLQKSFCYDPLRNWSVSVSWGYSVELYPSLVTTKVLEMAFGTFKTWSSWRSGPFTLNTRPVINDPCEMPLVYSLDSVGNAGFRETRSRYRKNLLRECQREEYKEALGVQHIDVLASRFTPEMWIKAPRRQCCEVMNDGGSRTKESFQVMIRECHRFESVTPP